MPKPPAYTPSTGTRGEFLRVPSAFRHWISPAHTPKAYRPQGFTAYKNTEITFPAEKNRYHLVISYACPWACRCLAVLKMKGLQEHITVSVVHPLFTPTRPLLDEHCGWHFKSPGDPPVASPSGLTHCDCDEVLTGGPDPVTGATFVRDIYEESLKAANFIDEEGNVVGDAGEGIGGSALKQTGGGGEAGKKDAADKATHTQHTSTTSTNPSPPRPRVTFSVPILWCKKTRLIVNNESEDIVRILNTEFNEFSTFPELDLFPIKHRSQILEVNEWVYRYINNGVYRCGFAKSQEAYDEAATQLYVHLDKAEEILSKQRYLASTDAPTEADIRFFMTLARFDEVYTQHFKTTAKCVREYSNIFAYCKELYRLPGVKESINMKHIRQHYFLSHPSINQFGIVPLSCGFLDKLESGEHGRDRVY